VEPRLCLEFPKAFGEARFLFEGDDHEAVATRDAVGLDIEDADPVVELTAQSIDAYDVLAPVAVDFVLVADSFAQRPHYLPRHVLQVVFSDAFHDKLTYARVRLSQQSSDTARNPASVIVLRSDQR